MNAGGLRLKDGLAEHQPREAVVFHWSRRRGVDAVSGKSRRRRGGEDDDDDDPNAGLGRLCEARRTWS